MLENAENNAPNASRTPGASQHPVIENEKSWRKLKSNSMPGQYEKRPPMRMQSPCTYPDQMGVTCPPHQRKLQSARDQSRAPQTACSYVHCRAMASCFARSSRYSFAISGTSGSSGVQTVSNEQIDSRTVVTSLSGDHASRKISIDTEPLRLMFAWKIGVMKFTTGGTCGYVGGNMMLTWNTPPAYGV